MNRVASLASGFAIMFVASSLFAHSFNKDSIVVGHPWSRATPAGATVGAGYLKISNNGKEADTLIGGTFNGADRVEVHEMRAEGDIMKMRKLTGGLEVKPGETVELKPSAHHLMFLGLKAPIIEGPAVKGSLLFEKAGKIDVEFKIEPIGTTDSDDHKH